jgi:NTE family protein
MALGEADTRARRDEVLHFFGWDTVAGRQRVQGGQPDIVIP